MAGSVYRFLFNYFNSITILNKINKRLFDFHKIKQNLCVIH